MLGTSLGPYQLLEELGSGGMAAVYRAHQATMGRDVAVKVIYQELADDTGREQFQREARLIARLEHPHILPVYDFDGQSNPPYIVMRYLAGGTLKETLTQQPPHEASQWRWYLRWLTQVAGALDYAHRQGIVHRDLKPSNIIFDTEKNAFLADFGIAALAGETLLEGESSLTGTPFYCSPEQALGQTQLGPAVDIYALGVLAFELFTHTLPFEADSFDELLEQHAHTPPPAITQRLPALPMRCDALWQRCLAKNPADRYPTAQAFVEALSLALGITFSHHPATTLAAAPLGPTEFNKVMTVLYADAANYVAWLAEAGHSRAPLTMLWTALRPLITQQGGELLEDRAEGLLAVWGARTTTENDPEAAVQAALALQAQARALLPAVAPSLIISLHTGPAHLTQPGPDQPYTLQGAPLTIVERLVELAEDAVLISHEVARLVWGVFDLTPAPSLKLRGRKDPLLTYQVLTRKARPFHMTLPKLAGSEPPLVGRATALAALQQAYLAMQADSTHHVRQGVTVLADAGLGKSRLLLEFARWMDLRPETVRLFQGRATPAHTQQPYALWREVLTNRCQILATDPQPVVQTKIERQLGELLGLAVAQGGALPRAESELAHFLGQLAGFDFAASPHIVGLLSDPQQFANRARQMVCRFFARLGAVQTVVIEIEDLHLADPASLQLFQQLLNTDLHFPLLLVGTARPNLAAHHPAWLTPTTLTLPPLDAAESAALAEALLSQVNDPPPALSQLLVERAGGNPLFMEALVNVLIEDRVLQPEGPTHWRVEAARLAHLRVPPTLVGVLQTRVDALLYPEKLTLQRAAVVGHTFTESALAALAASPLVPEPPYDWRAALKSLSARGLLHALENSDQTTYTFAQALLRDLLYDTLLERQRQTYHAALAQWLLTTPRVTERLTLLAHHQEQAGALVAAAQTLQQAGDQALQLSAFAEARAFYERALARLAHVAPEEQAAHLSTLHLKIGEVAYQLSQFAPAQTATENALRLAPTVGERASALAQLGRVLIELGQYAEAERLLLEALPPTRASGNQPALARLLTTLTQLCWKQNATAQGLTYATEAHALAEGLHDTPQLLKIINLLGALARQGGDMARADALRTQMYEMALASGNRERAMIALNNLGTSAYVRGDFQQALNYTEQALALAREIGARASEALFLLNLGDTTTELRQLEAAANYNRAGLALAGDIGSITRQLVGVMNFGWLRQAEGDLPGALRLLGLVWHHPASPSSNQREIEANLRKWGLDPAQLPPAFAEGAALDLPATIASLLAG